MARAVASDNQGGGVVEAILTGSLNTSRKIEALWSLGLRNAEIGRLLGVTDQYVSAVRGRLGLRSPRGTDAPRSIAETPAGYDVGPAPTTRSEEATPVPQVGFARVDSSGRIQIPPHLRDALGLRAGRSIQIKRDGDTLRLVPMDRATRDLQEQFRSLIAPDVDLPSELMAERKREAEGE